MTIERIEIKAALQAHEDGSISGIAWPWGAPDRVGDIFEKGAFGQLPATLPMLANHDQGQVLGVWDSFAETAEGFEVKGRLLIEDVAKAREARALVKAGAMTGLSVGFITKSAEPLRPKGRRITSAELVEISLCAIPMNDRARITSAKAATAATKESEMTEENSGAADTAELETKMNQIAETVATLPKIAERIDKLEAKSNRPGGGTAGGGENRAEIEGKALNSFLRGGAGALDTEQKSALNMGTNSAGGYVVAPEYSRTIIEKITEISPMRSAASVMAIGTTEVFIPVMTTPLVGGWVTETGARPESQPVFDQLKIETFEHAVIVPVSLQLIEDSFIDLQSYLAGQIGVQFGKAEASAFVNGDGNGKPLGFLDDPDEFEQIEIDQGVMVGNAGDLIGKLIDLYHKLPTAYARNGSWMLNRQTMGLIRRNADNELKGTLWSESLADGTPARFLGRPVVEAPDMADPVSTAETPVDTFPVAFGDFASGYRIVDRVGVQIMRDDFTGADSGLVKIRARRRVGGRLIQPEAIVVLKATPTAG